MSSDGAFSFRYQSSDDGGISLWLKVGDQPEIGPVQLDRTAADALGSLLERAVKLISEGQRRPSTPWEAPEESLDNIEPASPGYTDPFALKPRPR